MLKKVSAVAFCLALVAVAFSAQGNNSFSTGEPPLAQGVGPGTNAGGPEATEFLFRGDMVAESGLGCASTTPPITSGGPNDLAIGVTATLTPPFSISMFTYNVFTGAPTAPTLTALQASALMGGVTPEGAGVIGAQTGMPVATGTHTVAISPAIGPINSAAFYLNMFQPQTDSGIRLGLDNSGTGFSWIRAPTCGLAAFGTLDSIGFPGHWVMRALIDDMIPVELMTFSVN